MSGVDTFRVAFDGRADDRRRGVVSLRLFYLATAPLVAFVFIVVFGAAAVGLLVLYAACLLGALVLTAATAIVAHRRRTGTWDWRRWRPLRPRAGSVSVGLRLWPSATTESLSAQWHRSRWPRCLEVNGTADVLEVEHRIAQWFPPAGGPWESGVTATFRRLDGTTEMRLSRSRPTATTIEGTLTSTPTGCHFAGWVFGAKGHRSSPILEVLKAIGPAALLLFLAIGTAVKPDPTHPMPARLVAGIAVMGGFLLLIGWCHLMRLLFGTADASWALQHDVAALLDGGVVDVGDANPNASPRRFRRPPAGLGRDREPATTRATLHGHEPTTQGEHVRRAHRSRIVAIAAVSVLLMVLALFMAGAAFGAGSASVNPSELPAGHVYYGYVLADGTRTDPYIDCPSFTQTVTGTTDALCAAATRNSVTALAVLTILEVLLAASLVALDRSRRRLKVERVRLLRKPAADEAGQSSAAPLDSL